MKILYLYSELMGYQIPIFKEYILNYGAEVHVIHWDKQKFTPYIPPVIDGVYYYKRSEYSTNQLQKLVTDIDPKIIYISGWMDIGYLKVVRIMRQHGIPVVSGFDDIWWKTLKQRIASIFFPFVKSIFFSHAWVAGPYQFEYAKRLGFKNNEIIFNCLSADTELFNQSYLLSHPKKKITYPHRFLYVGRFEHVKGIDILADAWNNIFTRKMTKDWELCIIGNGSLEDYVKKYSFIKIINFLQPEILAGEIEKYGCFVLPSRREQWSLVIHEFSAAGLPVICSDICGAAPVFIIKDYNGYTFNSGQTEDLANQMLKIINLSDEQLLSMSENSHSIGQIITPKIAAACFTSIIK